MNKENSIEVDWERDYLLASDKSSPNQLAIVLGRKSEVISAIPIPSTVVPGAYDLDLSRLPADTNLVPALVLRRQNNLDLGSFSDETRFLTVANDFSERTRILALDGETIALNDLELFEWLVNAEREMYLGTDDHPVFEMALEDTACSFVRLPNGRVAMTEVSRAHIDSTRAIMHRLFGEDVVSLTNLTIETPLRCAARYFLTALPEGAAISRAGRESELTAFLLIDRSGFSFGLWSPMTGLFSEDAFLAPSEIDHEAGKNEESISSSRSEPDAKRSGDVERMDSYIKRALDQLSLLLSPEKLEQMQLSGCSQIVWATDRGLSETVESIVEQYATDTGLSFIKMEAPIDEAVAGGLLFGSFGFGDDTARGAEILPQVDLARDLLVLEDKEEIERRQVEESYLWKRRNRAVFALVAAPVFVVACLFAMVADILMQQTVFAVREVRADARTIELKPALERRKAYEANLKWYQEFITQVSALRRQQPVGIGMLYELNKNYPFELDPSFYVSDLKLSPDGSIEVTGLARNKDAVTSFLRSLEFAGGSESGTRLFSNLTYEVEEGVAEQILPSSGKPNVPTISGSTLTRADPAPGVIAWTIRGNYLPMAEFVPPDPKAKPPAKKVGVGQPASPQGVQQSNAAKPNP